MAKHRGRGMASINYPIGMNLGGDPSQALVHSNPDGKFTVTLSAIDLGQGMKQVTRQIAAETLGVPIADVYVDTADSDTGPHDMGSFASRGTHRVGNAVMVAAKEARGVMMEAAAEELEVNAADLETDGRGNIHVKGAPSRAISVKDVAVAAQFRQGKTIAGRGIFLIPLSEVNPETGEMSPVSCYAHACLVADLEVDDETGEVTMLKMTSAYELGRAINPRMVEQQLVGGAWMGMSHALYETPEPYYPDIAPRPARLQRVRHAGPGRHLPARHRRAGAPRAGRPVRRQGSRRDVRQPGAAGDRQRHLQCGRRAHRRTADHAGEGAARHQGAGRRAAARRTRRTALRPWRARQSRRHRQPRGAGATRSRSAFYLADDGLATAAYLALALGKPLLLEGAPGVGKTEAAKAIAGVLGRRLIRLQCYEGIDAAAALYEWNYPRQMLAIRQAGDKPVDIYRDEFLIERPMLQALRAPDSAVLLLDEIDRSDHEFEALLLEFLSDFTISIPERGTLSARERPVVILTSNRTRELHEALRRRCVYHFIAYPAPEREAQIIMLRASSVAEETARAVAAAVGRLRREPLTKPPGIAEAVDWAEAATVLAQGGATLARRLQALDRRRHQGRGGQRPHRAAARRHHHGGCGMSGAALPLPSQPFVAFASAAARQRLRRRRRSRPRHSCPPSRCWAAQPRRHPPRRPCDPRAAAGAARGVRCAVRRRTSSARSSWAARSASPTRTTCACRRTAAAASSRRASDDINEAGQAATAAEALSVRRFGPPDETEALRRFQRALPERLPQRRGYRRVAARRGTRPRPAARA